MRTLRKTILSASYVAVLTSGPFTICTVGAATTLPVLPLYSGSAPGSEHATQHEIRSPVLGEERVRNVTHPTLTAYLPTDNQATGTAVVIAPGGGFLMLSIQSEGEQVAKWLAARGIAAFVLKYRLNPTPDDGAAFQEQLLELMQSARDQDTAKSVGKTEGAKQAMADGLEAVRLVRQHAAEFGVSPDRIGFLGFSAGGMIAMNLATTYGADSRPNFVGSIYGALPEDHAVPEDAPPLFLAVAADDPLLAGASAPIFTAWRAKNKQAEMHVFQHGGHGFGLKQTGNSSDHWIDEFKWWMQSQGLLKTAR